MLMLEDKGGRPDRNEPDQRVRPDTICLLYGFSPKNPLTFQLNGRVCYVLERSKMGPNRIPYPVDDIWFECHVRGMPTTMDIPIEHLTVLDDSDRLIIEKMTKD
ncbi:TPA: hypothetical protein QCH88_004388 [Enterobacter asburiae]|nr:hypothetical protein EspYZU15_158 [Cronobacter phage EspYZU15]WAK45564.1 hypothetical protein EspYZU14_160 [Cronobacter phage EspYZU14]WBF78348.1 hypothetical protein [Cronobacter phage EspYZU12]HDR2377141.1 hypothetical protein [Enterobacter asburiae]